MKGLVKLVRYLVQVTGGLIKQGCARYPATGYYQIGYRLKRDIRITKYLGIRPSQNFG